MRWLVLVISVVVVMGPVSTEDLSNGWGTDYAWVDTLEAAQNKAIQQWKWVVVETINSYKHKYQHLIQNYSFYCLISVLCNYSISWQASDVDNPQVLVRSLQEAQIFVCQWWWGEVAVLRYRSLQLYMSDHVQVLELSENFIMINLGDDQEPNDEKFKPDGGYIPR